MGCKFITAKYSGSAGQWVVIKNKRSLYADTLGAGVLMQLAKRYAPHGSAHPSTEAQVAVWIMIAILFGFAATAIVALFAKVAG